MNIHDFQYINKLHFLNRSIQIILVLTFFLGINFFAANHFFREDISLNRAYSLSPESLAYLKKLKQPVEIIITVPPENQQAQTAQIFKTIKKLATNYTYATKNNLEGKISLTILNPYKETQLAQEIAKKYSVHKDNAIIIASGKHYRQISANDLYTFKNSQIQGFRGEQVFTSAILDVTGDQRQKVLFTQGHGEMRINNTDPIQGLSQLATILETLNLDVATTNLSELEVLPKDTNLLIIPSPKMPFLPKEINFLSQFLSENNGRVIVFLEPASPHGLESIFHHWGILADDMIILDSSKNFQASGGDLIIKHFAEHPITQFLLDYQLPILMGLSRPVRIDISSNPDFRRATTTLASSSPSSWAEKGYNDIDNISFDPNYDLPGPIPIAILSERQIDSQMGIKIPGGKLIVIGNSDAISNNRINALGNKIFLQNIINWSLDRNDLLNIPVKTLNQHQITISQKNLYNIAFSMFAFPAFFAILGLFIFTLRRR